MTDRDLLESIDELLADQLDQYQKWIAQRVEDMLSSACSEYQIIRLLDGDPSHPRCTNACDVELKIGFGFFLSPSCGSIADVETMQMNAQLGICSFNPGLTECGNPGTCCMDPEIQSQWVGYALRNVK